MNTICCLSKVELPVCSIECYPLGLCVCERGALAIFSSTISVGKGPSNPQSTTGIAVLKFLRTDLTRSFGSVTFRTNSRFIILYHTRASKKSYLGGKFPGAMRKICRPPLAAGKFFTLRASSLGTFAIFKLLAPILEGERPILP